MAKKVGKVASFEISFGHEIFGVCGQMTKKKGLFRLFLAVLAPTTCYK